MARYGFGGWIARRWKRSFPLGTFIINISGSFLLGYMAGSDWGHRVILLLGTGFMGAYTTFSTLNVESIQLASGNKTALLALYLGLTYTLGILLAWLGYAAA